MIVRETPLEGLLLIEPSVFRDPRGLFVETHNERVFSQHKIATRFVQDNMSVSVQKTLRGFHFQQGEGAQAKLVWVASGAVLDIVIDLRPHSSTFKQSYATQLDSSTHRQLFVPRGFAHGFVCLSDAAVFAYKCDNFYSKEHELGIRFDDPDLNLRFPFAVEDLVISEKDRQLPFLRDIEKSLH